MGNKKSTPSRSSDSPSSGNSNNQNDRNRVRPPRVETNAGSDYPGASRLNRGSSSAATNNSDVMSPPPSTVRSDLNVRKETIKLLPGTSRKVLQFTIDAQIDCRLRIWYVAKETPGPAGKGSVIQGRLESKPVNFERELCIVYTQPEVDAIDFTKFDANTLCYDPNKTIYPLIIRMEALKPNDEGHIPSQTTYCTFAINSSSQEYDVKAISQRVFISGRTYEVLEIYGLEGNGAPPVEGLTGEDCIICMSQPRDTTVLPCRHMCLCSDCAKQLRFKSDKCPICRSTVESLLQIKVNRTPSRLKQGLSPVPKQ